jgi:hypothetical protein
MFLSNGKLSSVSTFEIYSVEISKMIGFSAKLKSQALYLFRSPIGEAFIASRSPPSKSKGSTVVSERNEF